MTKPCNSSHLADSTRCSASKAASRSSRSFIPSLHPFAGAADGKGAPGADQVVSRTRRVLRFVRIWSNRIEHSWVGDLIGAVSIFGSFWLGLVLAHAMAGGVQ